MTADLCPHDDVPAACLDCLTGTPPERPNPPTDRPVADGRPFYAVFPGHCPSCNLAIHEHQPIVHMSDGTYQHERCADGR